MISAVVLNYLLVSDPVQPGHVAFAFPAILVQMAQGFLEGSAGDILCQDSVACSSHCKLINRLHESIVESSKGLRVIPGLCDQ